ncbi:oligosaccharide flippase family protein [Pseudoalteromonas sp. NBT06-2]|uniref:lipopolysaccharide biosynthesis protein n=1 Tax=Pseudoalteromonas sp. NBT06-2 TaxID=2025950 RepID=UPI001481E2EC|nr:oligosaccharide flippase family protein [Pseudoalteromonas sp. NBT06-2]
MSNFVITILLARLLNLTDFGLYSIVWLIVISIASLVQALIFSPMLSFSPKMSISRLRIFSNVTYSQLLVLLAILLFLLSLISFISYFFDLHTMFQVALGVLFVSIPYYLFEYFRRELMIQGRCIALLCTDCLTYLTILCCLYLFEVKSLYYAVMTISICFSGVVVVFMLTSNSRIVAFWLNTPEYRALIIKQYYFSKWLVASSGLQFLNGNVFTLFAGAFVSMAQVGYLRMAQNIVGIINPIYVFLDNHAQLYLARIKSEKGNEACEKAYLKVATLCMMGLSFILVILFTFKTEIITFVYGKQSAEVNEYMVLMIFLSFITGANFLERLISKVRENTHIIFKSYVHSSILSCISVYPLILYSEGRGAVLAMIFAQLIMLISILSSKTQKAVNSVK